MPGLDTLIKAIGEYGIAVVITAVFLFIIVIIIRNSNNTTKQLIQQCIDDNNDYKRMLQEQNNSITKEFEALIKTIDGTPHEHDLMKIFSKLNGSLKDYCRNTMDNIKAERLAIYLFHNGTYSTHGVHFFKMSCACERVNIGSGVRERSIEHSSIPINLFDDMTEGLISDGYYIIKKDQANLQYTNHKIFFSANKITYVQAVTIFDKDNNAIGFVLAEMDIPYSDDNAEKQRKIINNFITQIIPVLTYSEYKSMNLKTDK